jgi:hypothetical protein
VKESHRVKRILSLVALGCVVALIAANIGSFISYDIVLQINIEKPSVNRITRLEVTVLSVDHDEIVSHAFFVFSEDSSYIKPIKHELRLLKGRYDISYLLEEKGQDLKKKIKRSLLVEGDALVRHFVP